MISEIKERLTIVQLGKELFPDWMPAKSCRSPLRADTNPSFSVYNEGRSFMDFATGDKGDVIDFYALAKGISPPEALNALWDRLKNGTGHSERRHSPPESSRPSDKDPFVLPYRLSPAEVVRLREDCERLLTTPEAILAMAAIRGWDQKVVRGLALEGCLGLSSDGCITFNYLSGSKSRWLDVNGKRQFRWNFGRPWFWRGDLVPEADRVWIVEGETKLIKALCWGWEWTNKSTKRRVIALPAANFNPTPWAYLFKGKEVVYMADPDPAGQKAAERVRTALKSVAREIVVLYPKDLLPREK